MGPFTDWFHLQDCYYIPGQRTPLLSEDISHTFLLFVGYRRTVWSFNWLKPEVTQILFFLFLNSCKTKMGHVDPEAFFCSNGDANCCPNSSCSTQESRNWWSLVFMPAEQLFTACSSHSSITADTAWQTSENAHANKPRIRLTRLSPCFLQLLGKVSSHFCKKTGRQLLPSTGLARCSSPASPAPVSSLSGHPVFSAPLWKGLYCSYHWLGHDKEVLLRLVEQQVSTHHAVHLDGYWSIGVCLSLGSQVHLQESHSCEQGKHHHSWGHLFYNRNKLELLLCARVLISHQNLRAVTSATWSTCPEIPVQTM